jgi:hypothetical protein
LLVRRLILLVAMVAAALGATVALADAPSPGDQAGRSGDILGIVPVKSQAGHSGGSGGNLAYHNGPVMHTNKTYAIYWVPPGFSVSSGYESIINGFFQNVATATSGGATNNVYYSDTQYYDGTGTIANKPATFGGSIDDANAFPASGCSDSYTSVCLTDAQIQTEIAKVTAGGAYTHDGSTLYFMFTPKNVGSCYSGSSCAFSQYCAYHSHYGSGSTATLYANQPYAAYVPAACDSGQHPNGDDADATINVASHEHNEAITDAQGSAWYDRRGYENGDKCAWTFGAALGSTGGSSTQYNQAIGGGKYFLQREWSNASSGCVLTGK